MKPMLSVAPTTKITVTVTIDSAVAEMTDRYAAYIRASSDEVVNAALKLIFQRDKGFKAFCDANTKAIPVVPLRVARGKKSAAPASSSQTSGVAAD